MVKKDVQSVGTRLIASPVNMLSSQKSRRSLLKGMVAGSAGIAFATSALPAFADGPAHPWEHHPWEEHPEHGPGEHHPEHEPPMHPEEQIVTILSIARTAEQLAVTFYSNGVANADKLGLTGEDLEYIQAALIEEQIHQQFFTANGGQSIADTFSFPYGPATFEDAKLFFETQQQLEGVFDSAFLAAIKEFAMLGRPDLAQIAGQVACIEAEHRALGRAIAGMSPADNWAFTPVYLAHVADAPKVVTDAGYLSPTKGNSYMYVEVSTEDHGVEQREPYAASDAVVGNG